MTKSIRDEDPSISLFDPDVDSSDEIENTDDIVDNADGGDDWRESAATDSVLDYDTDEDDAEK